MGLLIPTPKSKKKKEKKKYNILNLFGKSMNKKAVSRGPTLTWFAIGIVVFIGVVLLIYSPDYGIYNQFMTDNGGTIDPVYAAAYDNLTSQQDIIKAWSADLSISSFASNLLQTASGMLNSFAIGFSAIRFFTQVPDFFNNLFNIISHMTGMPTPLFEMITIIVTIFFATKFIKAMRGTVDDI